NVEIRATNRRVASGVLSAEDVAARSTAARYLGAFTQATITHYYSADSIPLARLGAAVFPVAQAERPAAFRGFDYAQVGGQMRIFAGRLPDVTPAGSAYVEALITRTMAQAEGLQLGDTLVAAFLGSQDHPITAKVVGIWEPAQPNENYWNGLSF